MKSPQTPGRLIPGLALTAYLLGLLGLGAFTAFVLLNGLGLWPRSEPAANAIPWLVNLGWLTLFALQHSGMARQSFKDWLTRFVPAVLERPLYIALSGLLTLAVLFIWQPLPGGPVWEGPRWLIVISLAAALGVGLHCLWFDHAGFFGLRQAGVWGDPQHDESLRTDGAYRWVRHPLMTGTLLLLWTQPILWPEMLLLNFGLTVYILLAIPLEERDLVRHFGQAYRDYRRRVPALIPWRGRAGR